MAYDPRPHSWLYIKFNASLIYMRSQNNRNIKLESKPRYLKGQLGYQRYQCSTNGPGLKAKAGDRGKLAKATETVKPNGG